jgi:GNAT superfamily N-acetyltransferase
MSTIRELTSEADLRAAHPLMAELRTHLDLAAYEALLQAMRPQGYRLFALEDDGTQQALAGVAVCTNFYDLRHLYVYDLVTYPNARSRGYGAALMAHLREVARTEGCQYVVLSSGLWRTDAHRFYEQRIGMERRSYTFRLAV